MPESSLSPEGIVAIIASAMTFIGTGIAVKEYFARRQHRVQSGDVEISSAIALRPQPDRPPDALRQHDTADPFINIDSAPQADGPPTPSNLSSVNQSEARETTTENTASSTANINVQR